MSEPPAAQQRDTAGKALEVGPVPPEDRESALALLFQEFSEVERRERIAATLQAVSDGRFSLDGFVQALVGHERAGVALTLSQPDGVTLVWPPAVTVDSPVSVNLLFSRLLEFVCQRLDADGSRLGQVLLNEHEEHLAERLRPFGFTAESRLFFLGRTLQDGSALPAVELSRVGFSPETAGRFARLIEATYRGSRDCPLLEGLRTGEEALASHRQSGVFRPEHWQIFTETTSAGGAEDVAICLLNEHPEQDAVELTYFGVAPEWRGQGWGRKVICDAVQRAAAIGRGTMFLAVDAENHYANAIYAELSFVELARRQVLFRPCAGLARQSSTGS